MHLKWRHLALILAAICGSVHAEPASPRVAVIASPEAGDFAALVTTRLSSVPNLSLVERDDLAKIGDERALQEMARDKPADLGQLLHADGLLFLRKEGDSPAARLTAVRLGLVLFDVAFDPKVEAPQLADLLAGRIDRAKEKLLLPPDQAIPVSFLNLHADLGSPAMVRLEQALTLLLERQLAATPELVVLERRHAGSLTLERNLTADLPQVQTGAWWIDGSLARPSSTGPLSVRLHLRPPQAGTPLDIATEGKADDLPALAAALAGQVAAALHAGKAASADPAAAVREGREFLQEGIWAWRHNENAAAVEALDSAALLGETSADSFYVRADLFAKQAANEHHSTDERVADLREAIDACGRYAAMDGPNHLEILPPPRTTGVGRLDDLRGKIVETGSHLLQILHTPPRQPESEEALRQALRAFAEFDPLQRKCPNDWAIVGAAELWSESAPEEAAYFKNLCSPVRQRGTYWQRGTNALSFMQPQMFAARFLPAPAEREALFRQLLEDLVADSETRPAGLFLRAVHGSSPQREQDYQAFLDEIEKNRQAVFDSGDLWAWLNLAQSDDKAFPPPTDPKVIDLLRFYLQHESHWGGGAQKSWRPENFPKESAPALWDDLEGCKARCLAVQPGLAHVFAQLESAYVTRFGNPAPDARPATALKIDRFWHPEPSGGPPAIPGAIGDAKDGFWVLLGIGEKILYHVSADTLAATLIPTPFKHPLEMLTTPKALYILWIESNANKEKTSLSRFDIASGQWETKEGDGLTRLYEVGGRLYFSFVGNSDESSFGLYDWATGDKTILASNRRRPAQNEIDKKARFRLGGIFPGPGGHPLALIDNVPYLIPEGDGKWNPLFRAHAWYEAEKTLAFGGRTLIAGGVSQDHVEYAAVTVFDPSRDEPEEWLGALRTLPLDAANSGAPIVVNLPSLVWASQPRWAERLSPRDSFCPRGEDLIAFSSQRENGHRYTLLYFTHGRPDPVRIPLDFVLDDATKALLPALCTNLAPMVADPESAPIEILMFPVSQGLCFKPVGGGTWFLSFTDLDAYLQKLPAPPEKGGGA